MNSRNPWLLSVSGPARLACALPNSPNRILFSSMQKGSVQPRHDLFAQQLQRAGHRLGRDQGAEIQLGQDAVEPELLMQLLQTVGAIFRPADDDLVAHDLII